MLTPIRITAFIGLFGVTVLPASAQQTSNQCLSSFQAPAEQRDAWNRYRSLVEGDPRVSLRNILIDLVRNGLAQTPDDPSKAPNLLISFDTKRGDVDIPENFREQSRGEMAIALQYQYSGLSVGSDSFVVTLFFNQAPHQVRVPFDAVKLLMDRSIGFCLTFPWSAAR